MLSNRNSRNIAIDSKDMKAILFRNFTGKPDQFNPKGTMGNFTVVLNEGKARELEDLGLNIKHKTNRDGDDEARLQIFCRFENFPPKVYRKVGHNTVELDQDTIEILDNDEIEDADLIISPYSYDFNGRKGVKAYLYRGYFTVAEDQYAQRYLGDGDDEASAPF